MKLKIEKKVEIELDIDKPIYRHINICDSHGELNTYIYNKIWAHKNVIHLIRIETNYGSLGTNNESSYWKIDFKIGNHWLRDKDFKGEDISEKRFNEIYAKALSEMKI